MNRILKTSLVFHQIMGVQTFLPLKCKSQLQQTTNFVTSFQILEKNKIRYFKRLVCQQTILIKYHALLLFLKKRQNLKLSSAANYRWRFMGYYMGLVVIKPDFVV